MEKEKCKKGKWYFGVSKYTGDEFIFRFRRLAEAVDLNDDHGSDDKILVVTTDSLRLRDAKLFGDGHFDGFSGLRLATNKELQSVMDLIDLKTKTKTK